MGLVWKPSSSSILRFATATSDGRGIGAEAGEGSPASSILLPHPDVGLLCPLQNHQLQQLVSSSNAYTVFLELFEGKLNDNFFHLQYICQTSS